MTPLRLRAALTRGFVFVVANWPIVLIDLAVSAFAKAALVVPIAGGVLMVAALVGTDVGERFSEGLLAAADSVFASLGTSPEALAAFLVATALVAVGGDALTLIVRGGTLSILVDADRQAGEFGRRAIGDAELDAARVYSVERLVSGARRFARPMVRLALVRAVAYCLLAAAYVALVVTAVSGSGSGWPAWSAILLVATSAGIVGVAGINLLTDLLRIVMATDGCGLGAAWRRARRFVIEDARQVLGIVSVIAGIEIVASSITILATAGLAPVAYLPVVSVAVVPLQIAFWIVRGLLFELAALSSVAACQTQYRRFAGSGSTVPPSSRAAGQ